jgi:hypothetical protein
MKNDGPFNQFNQTIEIRMEIDRQSSCFLTGSEMSISVDFNI